MLSKGIIVSVQSYSAETTEELIIEIANAGAVAVRVDKKIKSRLPLIGLSKKRVAERVSESYITPTLDDVKEIERWSKCIAIDYRKINECLPEISEYCRKKELVIIADIGNIEDYENIIENDYYHTYIATTLSVLYKKYFGPDFEIIEQLKQMECNNIIAEGGFQTRSQVKKAFNMGVHSVCIGNAITNIYKLTKKYTTVRCA